MKVELTIEDCQAIIKVINSVNVTVEQAEPWQALRDKIKKEVENEKNISIVDN